jgi:hypothetical protein
MARQAARGETFPVPVFVGFSNIAIDASQPIELPWGRLRPYTGAGSELIPSEAHPPVLGGEGTQLGFVLETNYRYQLKVEEWPPGADTLMDFDWPAFMQEGPTRLDYQCDLTALAFSLGIERQPPVACSRMWTMVFDPLSHGANIGWRTSTPVSLEYYRAGETDAKRVAEWAEILETTEDSKIRVAHRRLLSALSERENPVDGFIDAVIAWENLFGSREGELTFRISTAMAKLLHDDPTSRLQAQRDLSKRYNRRSAVVHGSEELDPRQAIAERNAALEEAFKCLRRLYRDYPHLINDSNRARTLVLSL